MLTKKQQELLLYIHACMRKDGIPPSFDEMKDALELKSKSGIHRLITALEERGFIRRLPNRARALEVIKMPDSWRGNLPEVDNPAGSPVAPGLGGSGPAASGSVIQADFTANRQQRNAGPGSNVHAFPGQPEPRDEDAYGFSVPVMGRIAAGVPISAIQNNTHSITVPPEMIGKGEYFALEVQGDSMINAGIHDGDTVVIRQSVTADSGDIVVALIDDEEATLKTFRKQGSEIALEAANPAHETRLFSPERVKVQGCLAGLIRRYQ